jgi:hypothetical protein
LFAEVSSGSKADSFNLSNIDMMLASTEKRFKLGDQVFVQRQKQAHVNIEGGEGEVCGVKYSSECGCWMYVVKLSLCGRTVEIADDFLEKTRINLKEDQIRTRSSIMNSGQSIAKQFMKKYLPIFLLSILKHLMPKTLVPITRNRHQKNSLRKEGDLRLKRKVVCSNRKSKYWVKG